MAKRELRQYEVKLRRRKNEECPVSVHVKANRMFLDHRGGLLFVNSAVGAQSYDVVAAFAAGSWLSAGEADAQGTTKEAAQA